MFGWKLTTLVAEICTLGEKNDDETIIEVIFNVALDRFADVMNITKQWEDMSMMSIYVAIGRLSTFQNVQRGRRSSDRADLSRTFQ